MLEKNEVIRNNLSSFGFSFKSDSVHAKRTMMLKELSQLFEIVDESDAGVDRYKDAILNDNCLGKRSVANRKYSYECLKNLYALDHSYSIFRSLRYFWKRDVLGQPTLAFLCAYARDSLLRTVTPYILNLPIGSMPNKLNLEEFIDNKYPGRFSDKMLGSLGRNLLSTWTQSGHLIGHRNKTRTNPIVNAGSLSYALFLGYLTGNRGKGLLKTEYFQLLGCSSEYVFELAEEASRRGWIVFKQAKEVIEVLFPQHISSQELEWLREQD